MMGKTNKLKAALQSQQFRFQKQQQSVKAARVAEERARHKVKNKKKFKPGAGLCRPVITVPFRLTDRILLIGEGNFSFARSLIRDPPPSLCFLPPQNLTATTLDSEEECFSKYPDAVSIVSELRESGVNVLFKIDATKLDKESALKGAKWDRVCFNFPHAGEWSP
jgi:25S rRNA (uracil2634-N3)-methyltransferase